MIALAIQEHRRRQSDLLFYSCFTAFTALGAMVCGMSALLCKGNEPSDYMVFDRDQTLLGFLRADDIIHRADIKALEAISHLLIRPSSPAPIEPPLITIGYYQTACGYGSKIASNLTGKALETITRGLVSLGVKTTGISMPSQTNYAQYAYGFLLATGVMLGAAVYSEYKRRQARQQIPDYIINPPNANPAGFMPPPLITVNISRHPDSSNDLAAPLLPSGRV